MGDLQSALRVARGFAKISMIWRNGESTKEDRRDSIGFGLLTVGALICPADGPCGEAAFGALMVRNVGCILK